MINQQLLQTTKWVQDRDAKACKKCQNPFKAIFRRKHHCRNCGQLFCDSCSNYFMDKTNFKNYHEIKKNKVRLCQDCFNDITKKLRDSGEIVKDKDSLSVLKSQQLRRHSKSFNVTEEKLPESAKQTSPPPPLQLVPQIKIDPQPLSQTCKLQIPDTITIGDDIEQKQLKLEESMISKIEEFVERRTLAYGIKENWQATMLQFILNAIEYLKYAETLPLKQKILLIKIKIIPFINYAATQYLRGVTITKNIAHKRMKTHHKSPSFLLLTGSLDLDIQNFDNVVKNQHKYLQQALEQIDMLNPNIILIEKGINNILLNEFLKRDITVSIQCSQKQLQKVEIAVKARIQRAADVFNRCCDKDCLGKSDTASYVSCDPDSIKQNSTLYSRLDEKDKALLEAHLEKKKNKNKDKTLLFIHTPQYATSFQITLSGPRLTELIDVKKCFQQLCCICYSMSLELSMILLDQKLKQDLEQKYKQIDNQKSPMMITGEILDFSISSMTEHENQQIKLCKVRFHPAVISTIHDIQKRNNDESLENYIKQNIKNINNKKISYFSQFCNFTKEIVKFYEDRDFGLGHYISSKAVDTTTKYCSIKQIHHVSIRYGPGAFVRCVVERKKQQNLQVKASVNLTKENIKKEQSFLQMQSLNDDTSTQCETVQGDSDFKVHQQLNMNIITYIKCLNSNCDRQLTKSFKLERSHLEFSFEKLIQYLIMSALRWKKINKTNWLVFDGELNEQGDQFDGCNHSLTERVFECNDFQVKLFTNLFDIYRIKHFQFNCQEVKQHIEKSDKEEIDKRKDTLICHLQKLQQQILKNDKGVRESYLMNSNLSFDKDPNQFFQVPESSLSLVGNFMERLTQSPYPDFLALEQESMQLYSRIYQIEVTDQLRISKIKNESQISKQKTSQFSFVTNESGPSIKNPFRKTLKETTITMSTINENLFPIQLLPTQQYTQSPESPSQDNFNQFEEQSEAGFEKQYDNDQNQQNSIKSCLLNWPKAALNFDQSNMPIKSFFEFIPIYNQNDIGLVASALNHPKYYDLYENKYRFTEFWEKIQDQSLQKEVQMEAAKILKDQLKNAVIEEFQIKLSKFTALLKKTSLNNLQEVDEDEQAVIQTSAESPRRQQKSVTIQLYYPKQFECFRMLNGINIKQFIKSIASCSNWNSAGGKSGSTFYKSADNLFIFKAVKESEFSMFESFAPKYFEHLYSNISNQRPSVLNKIYGMFTIKNSRGTQYLIAMENLFWGLDGELTVYDLKGSEAKRWNRKNLKTLLDTNYIIDRNGEPLPVQEQDFNFLEIALESDSEFLLEVEVVDYSLLLIIDNKNHQIKLSIIDYLQCYDFMKKMETKLKTAINFGAPPTIIKPAVYQERFMKAMKKYFMGIYSSL
ncbi:unnamed protein product [Paramecium octaurelia]|uniref:1-phosphatidylinositol-3-phosphate 5-kinase n=1 Tax=Paramecium octaurelia TaxID=43137 RepID=A0A8S1UKS1_PAROT|nr:unnamed protein product [Paramecium octaurelia]